jgi:hypothetical protein
MSRLYLYTVQDMESIEKNVLSFIYASMPTLQRHNMENSKKISPEKELCGLSPNFLIHVSVSDLYIPRIGLSILLLENMWTDSGNIYVNRSQTQKSGN